MKHNMHERFHRMKTKRYLVKGISPKPWDDCQCDGGPKTRQLLKRDMAHQFKAWGIE